MKLPEPVAYLHIPLETWGGKIRPVASLSKYDEPNVYSEVTNLCTESQLREALEKQRAVMRQALDALNGLFGIPDALTGQGGGSVAVWRLMGPQQPREAIKALEEALK